MFETLNLNELKTLCDFLVNVALVDGIFTKAEDKKIRGYLAKIGLEESYIKDLTNSITKLLEELKENNNKLYDLAYERREASTKIEDKKQLIERKTKSNANNILRSLTPLFISIVSISTLLGASTAIFNKDTYMTTTEFYSSGDGAVPDTKKYEKLLLNNNKESTPELTTLTVYDPWVKSEDSGYYERTARIAEIPSEDFEELSKLSSIDIESTDYKFSENPQSSASLQTAPFRKELPQVLLLDSVENTP